MGGVMLRFSLVTWAVLGKSTCEFSVMACQPAMPPEYVLKDLQSVSISQMG